MSGSAKALQLPAAVVRRVNRAAKKLNREPSDLAAEALEWYLRVCALPEQAPTPAEVRVFTGAEKHSRKASTSRSMNSGEKKPWFIALAGSAPKSSGALF